MCPIRYNKIYGYWGILAKVAFWRQKKLRSVIFKGAKINAGDGLWVISMIMGKAQNSNWSVIADFGLSRFIYFFSKLKFRKTFLRSKVSDIPINGIFSFTRLPMDITLIHSPAFNFDASSEEHLLPPKLPISCQRTQQKLHLILYMFNPKLTRMFTIASLSLTRLTSSHKKEEKKSNIRSSRLPYASSMLCTWSLLSSLLASRSFCSTSCRCSAINKDANDLVWKKSTQNWWLHSRWVAKNASARKLTMSSSTWLKVNSFNLQKRKREKKKPKNQEKEKNKRLDPLDEFRGHA